MSDLTSFHKVQGLYEVLTTIAILAFGGAYAKVNIPKINLNVMVGGVEGDVSSLILLIALILQLNLALILSDLKD